ncbi:MAG: RNA polymerase factor sigma-54 [Porticoccaceae bacterium]|nr:RNA polymerase factor sigma-54 [Pseudomonadales bacterium]MCP5172602.1 RNA polymerase factor sigma-54 [Pseudomonadales bacterium]MCP5303518.1 RNA polymerase factor sigma-54 [Pseudomonadales bacterium]
MKQSLQLKIGQQLTMTPQLQQAIKLLQLSSLELQQEIQQALYSNPLLEVDEDSPESGQQDDDNRKSASSEEETSPLNSSPDDDQPIPTDLPVDASWDDIYPTAPTTNLSNSSSDYSADFESFHSVTESLQDHLHWQLNLTPMSDIDRHIGTTIIDAISPDGRLTQTPADLWAALDDDEIELDEVIAVIHRIQQFDPPGVAASSLQECLSIQLNQFSENTPFLAEAKLLVTQYLPLVANRDFKTLTKATGLNSDILEFAIELIQTLNPLPGDSIDSADAGYVVPDARVVKRDGCWQVSLNSDVSPKISINQQYASLIRRADNSNDNTFLRNHLQEAKWFLRSLESRNETLLRVSSSIVELQQDFLEHGAEAMKPMILADIAEKLELHESTISRVTTQKYIDTPQGIYELKYFFSSHVGTTGGGECSSTAIRAILKKMISAENPSKPLSDNKLASLLQEQGIEIARRTVAKYREGMNIPSSSERRQFNN